VNIQIVDVLIHVPADLAIGERVSIERDLQGCDGIVSAHFVRDQPHMLEVAYNPATVSTALLREHLADRGLRVSLAGM